MVRLIARRVNRSDVDDFFTGSVRETSPRNAQQTKRNEYDSERFVHGGLPSRLIYFSNTFAICPIFF